MDSDASSSSLPRFSPNPAELMKNQYDPLYFIELASRFRASKQYLQALTAAQRVLQLRPDNTIAQDLVRELEPLARISPNIYPGPLQEPRPNQTTQFTTDSANPTVPSPQPEPVHMSDSNAARLSAGAAMRATVSIVEKNVTPEISTSMLGQIFGSGVPAHVLTVQVTFSEEAKAAIKKLKLENQSLVSAPKTVNRAMRDYYREEGQERPKNYILVRQLLTGATVELPFEDIFEAQAGMRTLQEGLKSLKSLFTVAEAPTSQTFEI